MTTVAALEKLLAAGHDNALLRFGLGNAHLDAGDAAQALPHLQRCVEFDPNYSAAWKLLGKAQTMLGDQDAARTAWQQGLDAARRHGDKQAEKEMTVFLARLERQRPH